MMRLVDWNIEHMNSWFVPNGHPNSPALRDSFPGSSFGGGPIADVPALALRAANVLTSLDPDIICIQEGAGVAEAEIFLGNFLPLPGGATWTVFGGSGGAQKLIVATRTDRDVTAISVADDSGMQVQLHEDFVADADADGEEETDARFARIPQVVDVVAHGENLRIINAHLKSKFVPNGQALFNGTPEERRQFIQHALKNRRRIRAEAFRIRSYMDELFTADPDRLLILTGDLNDGPGFDFFERRFLASSVVDLAFGSVLLPDGRLTHTMIRAGQSRPASAFFDDFVEGVQNKPLLLDHVGVSPALAEWVDEARVATAEFDAESQPAAANERERLPSDHRPLFVELTPPN